MSHQRNTRLYPLRRLLACVTALASLLWPTAVAALDHPIADAGGFQKNHDSFTGLPYEYVDTLNGNLLLTFTDLALPGNAGSQLRFTRTYNSKQGRWTFGLAGMVMRINDMTPFWYPESDPRSNDPAHFDSEIPHFVTADGADQPTPWADTLVVTTAATLKSSARWTISGQFFRFDRLERKVYLPDGTIWSYDEGPEEVPDAGETRGLRLTSIVDPFGNAVDIGYDGHDRIETVTQHFGGSSRTVTFGYSNDSEFQPPTSMEFLGRHWNYGYQSTSQLYPVMTSASGPTGPSWSFDYGGNGAHDTELTTVHTPQGGTISYTFGTHSLGMIYPIGEPHSFEVTRVVEQRTVGGRGVDASTWTYQYGGLDTSTLETAPDGVKTWYAHTLGAFAPALGGGGVISRIVQNADGVEIEREETDYTEFGVAIDDEHTVGWVQVPKERRLQRGAGTPTYTTTYNFDFVNGTSYLNSRWPQRTTETGTKTRVTTRTFDRNFNATLPDRDERQNLGRPKSETVTVAGESFVNEWDYDNDTAFRTKETAHGIPTDFTPDSFGNVHTATDANSHVTTYEYTWGVASKITPPIGATEVTRQVNQDSTVASQTQAGRTTSYMYDALGRPTRESPPGTTATVITYASDGSSITQTRGVSWTQTFLDGVGRPTRTVNAVGATTSKEYDFAGRVTRESLSYYSGETPTWTVNAYDGLGRRTRITHPDDSRVAYAYSGNELVVTDERNQETHQYFDVFGDPKEARVAGLIDARGNVWNYSYNAIGNLTKVVAPDSRERRWNYNSKGLLTSDQQPESGTTTYGHDAVGNMTSKLGADGVNRTFTYDDNNRLTRVDGPNGQRNVIGYEDGTDLIKSFESQPRIQSLFYYDNTGRQYRRRDSIDGRLFETNQTWDGRDNVKNLTYPDGRLIEYTYDEANRITKIEDQSNPSHFVTYASVFGYHASGALETYKAGNNVVTAIDYDNDRLWPNTIDVTAPGGGALLSMGYQFDLTGNVEHINEPTRNGFNFSQTFGYDELSRLTHAAGRYGSGDYWYDVHGNQNLIGGNRNYDLDHLRLDADNDQHLAFQYDQSGHVTRRQNTVSGVSDLFTYNMNGMMATAAVNGRSLTYDYGPEDARILRQEADGGVQVRSFFIHGLGSQLLAEAEQRDSGEIVPLRDYIYAQNRLIAVAKPTGASVSWSAPAQNVDETAHNALATIVLHLPNGATLANPTRVTYSINEGTAREGADYSPTSTLRYVDFPAGAANGETRTVSVGILADTKDEDDETFDLRIVSVDGTVVHIGNTATQTVTIVDDDEPPFVNISADVSVLENAGHATLTVSLSEPSGKEVKVNWFTTPGQVLSCAYFTTTAATLTFPRDTTSITVPIAVDVVNNDRGNEPAKWFFVSLDTLQNLRPGRLQARVTVNSEDDAVSIDLTKPGVSLADVRGTGIDYLLLGNPYASAVPTTLTFVFDDGSAMRKTLTLTPHQRLSIDLRSYPDVACATGVSVGVQVPTMAQLISADHAGYRGSGGVSSEGVSGAGKWYFAEGNNAFGRERITAFNPNDVSVSVRLDFYSKTGAAGSDTKVLPPLSRYAWQVDELVSVGDHGTMLTATGPSGELRPIIADRTVSANSTKVWHGADAHSSPGISTPDTQAYLAEGNHLGSLKPYLAVLSASDTPTTLHVTYLTDDGLGIPYDTTWTLPARSRLTVEPPVQLPTAGFGYHLWTDPAVPFVAERSMYGVTPGANPVYTSGNVGVAVRAPSGVRAFAEGATGPYQTFFLVNNPSDNTARVVFDFYNETGARLLRQVLVVPPRTRKDMNVNTLPGMSAAVFQTIVSSSTPVVTERVSYWSSTTGMIMLHDMLMAFVPNMTPILPYMLEGESEGGPVYQGPPPFDSLVTPTLVGPAWSQIGEHYANGVTLNTTSPPGDGSHLSGGWQVAATYNGPFVSFATASSTVAESVGSVTPALKIRTQDNTELAEAITVKLRASSFGGLAATEGADFNANVVTMVIPAHTASGALVPITGINVVNDTSDETDESFRITILDVDGGIVDVPDTHDVTIVDDDDPSVVSINDVTVSEAAGSATFTVSLDRPSGKSVIVNVGTVNPPLGPGIATPGLDYTSSANLLVFSPGVTQLSFSVPIINDTVVEQTEAISVRFSIFVNGTAGRNDGTATILDNEPPPQPLELQLVGQYFPDVDVSAGKSAYVLIMNPYAVPVPARLTMLKANGAGSKHEFTVPASSRMTIDLHSEPFINGQSDVSVMLQSLDVPHGLMAEASGYWDADWHGGRIDRGGSPSNTWYFAEGASNLYFEEYLTVINAANEATNVVVSLVGDDGVVRTSNHHIEEGPGRLRIPISSLTTSLVHGMSVTATNVSGTPGLIVPERTMYWANGDRREGHGVVGVQGTSTTWYFAEGANGGYTTFLALANFGATAATVQINYLLDGGGTPQTQTTTVPAHSRVTVSPPTMAVSPFAIEVLSTNGVPIVADRTIYTDTDWKLGDSSRGSPTLGTQWGFAEGAGAGYFTTFLMFGNPSTTAAVVTVTFRFEDGTTTSTTTTVPARGRVTIPLANIAALSGRTFAINASVTNGVPIVAERTMYWPTPTRLGMHIGMGRTQ